MFLNSLLKRVYKNDKNEKGSRVMYYCLLGLGGSVVGYRYGYRYSDNEDYQKYLYKYESEEQLHQSISLTGKPVVMMFYLPGDKYSIYHRPSYLKAAKQHHQHCDFMMINCAQDFQLCQKREFKSIPQVEVVTIGKENQLQSVRSNKDYTLDGVTAFLQETRAIPTHTPTTRYHQSAIPLVQQAIQHTF